MKDIVWGVAGNAIALRGDSGIMPILDKWRAQFAVDLDPTFELTIHGQLDTTTNAPGITFENDTVRYGSPDAQGYANFQTAHGELALRSAAHWPEADYFLRVVLGGLALAQNKLLFHGAGVIDAKRAWIFFGPSGAGKTTAAKASAPRPILHDDLLLFAPEESGWQAHATPFLSSGGLRPEKPISAPLAGLCHLIQAKQVAAERLSPASTVARLLKCVPVVTTSPRLAGQAMDLCYRLAKSVPCFDLRFLPDASFWEVLYDFR
jgi:hypothetical protein